MQIYERVTVANDSSCTRGGDNLAVVHACKSPCHQNAVGYRGKLSATHPNYLVLENDNDLFLNIIDPPVPLFMPRCLVDFLIFQTSIGSQDNICLSTAIKVSPEPLHWHCCSWQRGFR